MSVSLSDPSHPKSALQYFYVLSFLHVFGMAEAMGFISASLRGMITMRHNRRYYIVSNHSKVQQERMLVPFPLIHDHVPYLIHCTVMV